MYYTSSCSCSRSCSVPPTLLSTSFGSASLSQAYGLTANTNGDNDEGNTRDIYDCWKQDYIGGSGERPVFRRLDSADGEA